MDPTATNDYGYGSDNLDNGFAKYSFPGQNQYDPSYPAREQSAQSRPQQQQQQQQQSYDDQMRQPYSNQTVQDGTKMSEENGKFKEMFNSSFPDTKKDLLFSKAFYFFFFAAFGSLFPLIGIYFKQLGMSPLQTGFLIGLRPFVELFAGPFWGNLAERWKKWKAILIGSLSCWIIFTVCLAFVQPPANSCLIHNGTDIFVAKPYTIGGLTFEDMAPRDNNKETRAKRSLGDPIRPGNNLHINSTLIWRTEEREKLPANNHLRFKRGTAEGKVGKKMTTNVAAAEVKTKSKDKLKSTTTPAAVEPEDEEEKYDEETNDEKYNDDSEKSEETVDESDEEEDDEYFEEDEPFDATKVESKHKFYQFKQFPYPAIDIPGLSPLPLNHEHIMNLEQEDVRGLVSPPLSAVVYRSQDVRSIFLILLILQILGEFLSTPSLTLADTVTLGYLDGQTENYGKQRIYGSLGWAVSMFFVGIALDYSNVFSNHPCGTEHLVDRNYMTCYAVFGIFMFCALVIALQFRFKEPDSPIQSVQLQQLKGKVLDKVNLRTGDKREDEKTENGVIEAGASQPDLKPNLPRQESELKSNPVTYIPRGKPGQAGTMPHWIAVLKMFAPIQFSSMFFVLWFVGFGVGLVFAFLFWHLQDLGGSPTLFGIASVINHLSELGAFLFIKNVVMKIGHIKVVYIGLTANIIRFLTLSYISSPWAVLPFELLQGITHAAVWAAGVSYMTQAIPEENKPTAHMILQSLHLAVGRGCGTIIGGIFISSYGTQSVFRGYGITCLIVAVGYFALNFFFISKLPPIVGAPPMTNEFNEDSSYIAPHGVPGSAITKSASSSKLDKGMDQQQPQYQYQQRADMSQGENPQAVYMPMYAHSNEPQRVSDGIYKPGVQWSQY